MGPLGVVISNSLQFKISPEIESVTHRQNFEMNDLDLWTFDLKVVCLHIEVVWKSSNAFLDIERIRKSYNQTKRQTDGLTVKQTDLN